MAAWQRGEPESGSASMPSAGLTLGEMISNFLDARAKSKRNRSVQDDRERSRPLLAYFGADTPVSAIITARVADYRLRVPAASRPALVELWREVAPA